MRRAFILAQYHLRSAWNWRPLHYGRVVEPLVFFGLLVSGLGAMVGTVAVSGTEIPYTDFALAGVLCLIAVRLWSSAVADVANDRKWGVFALARLQGASSLQYVLSIVVGMLPVFLLQLVLVMVLYAVTGQGALGVVEIGAMTVVALLVVGFWTAVGVAVGGFVDSYYRRDLLLSLLPLPIVFSAPLFWVRETAPPFLARVSVVNPLTYHVDALRATFMGGSVLAPVATLALLMVAAVAVAWWAVRRQPLLSSEQG